MRCLDLFFNKIFPAIPEDSRQSFRENLTGVDITDAVEWFYRVSPKEYWDYEKDFPSVRSPWTFAWFETAFPKVTNNEGQLRRIDSPFRKLGYLVVSWPLPSDFKLSSRHPFIDTILHMAANDINNHIPPYDDRVRLDGQEGRTIASAQVSTMYGFTYEGQCIPLIADPIYLDEAGKVFSIARTLMLMNPELSRDTTTGLQESFIKEAEIWLLPLYFSLALLHTKNFELQNEKLPSQKKTKCIKERVPQHMFKVLNISPLKKQYSKSGSEGGIEGLKRSFHECRGHFRTYASDSKLFGKHEGTFWIPQHDRGTKDAGEVHKEYRLTPRP